MQYPGSNPDIPVEAEITFEEMFDRADPGTTRIMAHLDITPSGNGSDSRTRKLVIFPHREWNPPLGIPVLCILYPVRRAAVAAPKGGIPSEEKAETPVNGEPVRS